MINLALFFAILQGLSIGTYLTLQKIGSININSVLGAMIASGIAFIVNFVILIGLKTSGHKILFSYKGLLLLILMGFAAAGNDLFGLLAYSKGLSMIGSFLVIGIYSIIIIVMGFIILKEPLHLGKTIAILLILGGILLLQKFGI